MSNSNRTTSHIHSFPVNRNVERSVDVLCANKQNKTLFFHTKVEFHFRTLNLMSHVVLDNMIRHSLLHKSTAEKQAIA